MKGPSRAKSGEKRVSISQSSLHPDFVLVANVSEQQIIDLLYLERDASIDIDFTLKQDN